MAIFIDGFLGWAEADIVTETDHGLLASEQSSCCKNAAVQQNAF
jgi:hypothetical protein